jgi:hypothetical protein
MTRVGPFATSLFAALGALAAASGLARGGDNEMILAGTEAPDGKYP